MFNIKKVQKKNTRFPACTWKTDVHIGFCSIFVQNLTSAHHKNFSAPKKSSLMDTQCHDLKSANERHTSLSTVWCDIEMEGGKNSFYVGVKVVRSLAEFCRPGKDTVMHAQKWSWNIRLLFCKKMSYFCAVPQSTQLIRAEDRIHQSRGEQQN